MRKLLILTLPVLILVATAAWLELGFAARSAMDSRLARGAVSGRTRILFIGDSVLGFLAQSGTLAAITAKQLGEIAPERFEFGEFSRPALRTPELARRIDLIAGTQKPALVVMMVGKSDYPNDENPFLSRAGWLFELRFSRLLQAAYWDLARRWKSEKPVETSRESEDALRAAWYFFGREDCPRAIPKFEEALRLGIQRDRPLRALHSCYILLGRLQQGIEFYNGVREISAHRALVNELSAVLQFKIDQKKNPTTSPKFKLRENAKLTRDLVRTRLWAAWQSNQPAEFAQEFSEMPVQLSDRLLESSVQNLRFVLQELSQRKIRVLLLQYPLDYASVLADSLVSLPEGVKIIDLRSLLNSAPPEKLMTLWQADMEHLNDKGAALISERLASEIVRSIENE